MSFNLLSIQKTHYETIIHSTCLHNDVSVRPTCSPYRPTRSLSLTWHTTSLDHYRPITIVQFDMPTSRRLWNHIPHLFRPPHQFCSNSPLYALVNSSFHSHHSHEHQSVFKSTLKTYVTNLHV